ncbi:MAG: helix-turn-helix domain-containing protein [Hyphomicrobiaceae bacterium]
MGFHRHTLQRQSEEESSRYSDLLEGVRIARALGRIEEIELQFTEIALTAGCGGASGFSRSFRCYTGMSPSQVRRLIVPDQARRCRSAWIIRINERSNSDASVLDRTFDSRAKVVKRS